MPQAASTTVVIATRNRVEELCSTLERLAELPERPAVTVVDNASTDATRRRVGSRFPGVRLIALPENHGAAARTVGARLAHTPWVAFCDDDSWWAPGALEAAAARFARHPALAVVAARPVIEPEGTVDPIARQMADSPLPRAHDLPGPAVLGFLACGAVVRREAYLAVGGFHPLLVIGGEERLLAYDLVAAGWGLAYLDDVVAHHRPSPSRDPSARRALDLRNEALIGWLRRPLDRAIALTAELTRRAAQEPEARRALIALARALPQAMRGRRVLPPRVESQVRLLERFEETEATHAEHAYA